MSSLLLLLVSFLADCTKSDFELANSSSSEIFININEVWR